MKTVKYITALTLTAMLAACTSEEEAGGYLNDVNAVKVNATLGNSPFSRSNPLGSEEEQRQFSDGDAIAVDNGTQTVEYTYNSSAWVPSPATDYLKWESAPITFKAWHPADGNSFEEGHILTDQSTTENLAKSDYMTAEQAYVTIPVDHTLTLQMERRTARVIIRIQKFNDQFEGTPPVVTSLTIRSQYATTAQGGSATAITPYRTGEGKADGTFTALVVPGGGDAEATFLEMTVTYNTDHTLPFTVKGIPAAEAGRSYTYDLVVGKDKVTVGNVTVAEWGTGSLTGGEAELLLSEANVETNTVTNYEAGKITTDVIGEALADGTELKIEGPMNADDINTLMKYYYENYLDGGKYLNLDLSRAELTEIPDDAFYLYFHGGMETAFTFSLASIILPETVVRIGNYAFSNCRSLTTFTCPAALREIGEQAFGYTNITELTLPENLTTISDYAFIRMLKLKTLVFKGNITSVGEYAFGTSNHSSDTPPESLSIDLSKCTAVPTTSGSLFFDVKPQNITFIVPKELVDDFKSDQQFGKYTIQASGN